MFALRVDNGERIWQTPPPGCGTRRPCSPAQSAAVTAIPGVVFSTSLDGHLRAYSTAGGRIFSSTGSGSMEWSADLFDAAGPRPADAAA